ncbi:MAG: hypothetical protein WC784_02575 [Candidatus Shapirobacteria bacterium]
MPETREKDKEVPQNILENKVRIVDIGRDNVNQEPIPREIKTWMEKVEEASSLNSQSINDDQGQPILTPSAPVNPKIILPLTRQTFLTGFKKSFEDAGHWLSVFFLRFIKIKKGNVIFKNNDPQ